MGKLLSCQVMAPTFRAQRQIRDAMLALPARLRRRAPHARCTPLHATLSLSCLAQGMPHKAEPCELDTFY